MKKSIWRGMGLLTGFLAAIVSLSVSAAESSYHDCARNGIERTVELRIEGEGGVPCRIVYHRGQEGVASRLMWRAEANPDYCTTKLSGFLTKLKTKYNWRCEPRAQKPEAAAVVVTTNSSVNDAVINQTAPVVSPAEPALAAAKAAELAREVPVSPQNASSETQIVRPGAKENTPGQSELTFEQLRRFFPPGFYTADSQNNSSGTIESCPGDGHFVWNTRDRGQPVFELGRRFEFYVNLDKADGAGAQILQTGRPGTCPALLTSIHCGLGPGDNLESLRSRSGKYSCESLGLPEFNRDEGGLVLFSQRTILSSGQCVSDMPAGLMAMSASPASAGNSGYLNSAAIQFLSKPTDGASESTGLGASSLPCRYVLGK